MRIDYGMFYRKFHINTVKKWTYSHHQHMSHIFQKAQVTSKKNNTADLKLFQMVRIYRKQVPNIPQIFYQLKEEP